MTNPEERPRWFRPPRPHGHLIEDRSVSFLELFYDLVFVLLIAQIAHTLAAHVTWTGIRDFTVVFALIWLAWVNGTLYHELHGGEDGRSRTYIFLQMSILAPLAVFTGHAADDAEDGRWFAVIFALLLLLIAWQWFDVRRFDTPEWRGVAGRYVAGMLLIAVIVFASAFVDDPNTRVLWWAAAVGVSLLGNLVLNLRQEEGEMADALRATDSLVERFGLFTIIVLGEVVVGVADGLAATEHSFVTIATGLVALWLGFAFWWNYFDLVGGRLPRRGRAQLGWFYLHLPMTIGISAAGAGMVGLIEHAADGRTPTPTAWLVAGATACVAVSIGLMTRSIEPHPGRHAALHTLLAAATGTVVLAIVRPAPWLFTLLIYGLLSFVWLESFRRHTRHGAMITDLN